MTNQLAAMGIVIKQWNDSTVQVAQVWLDRAIDLVWEHGTTSTLPARILQMESTGSGVVTETADMYIVIAQREVAEQRKGYRRAARDLRAAADLAHEDGPNRSLTEWAVYVAGASFLEQRAGS